MNREYIIKNNVRVKIAKLSAELIFLNRAKDYIAAKYMAAQNFKNGKKFLPSNEEIKNHINLLLQLHEGYNNMEEYLFTLRNEALNIMLELYQFAPVLTGKLCTNFIHNTCDIQLSIFNNDSDVVTKFVEEKYNIQEVQKHDGGLILHMAHEDLKNPIKIDVFSCDRQFQEKEMVFWNIYVLASHLNRLHDLHQKEEDLEFFESEINTGCFVII